MHATPFPVTASRAQRRGSSVDVDLLRRAGRTVLLVGLSLFIVFGPAVGQVFGRHTLLLREWIMFSGSGVGVLKGSFTLRHADGTATSLTPLAVLGLTRYPSDPPDVFGRLVLADDDLRAYAAPLCDSRAGTLSFHGWVGTRQGWRPLAADDVCALPLPPAPVTAP